MQWAAQCKGNPGSWKTFFLAYVQGKQFSIEGVGAIFESSIQFLYYSTSDVGAKFGWKEFFLEVQVTYNWHFLTCRLPRQSFLSLLSLFAGLSDLVYLGCIRSLILSQLTCMLMPFVKGISYFATRQVFMLSDNPSHLCVVQSITENRKRRYKLGSLRWTRAGVTS